MSGIPNEVNGAKFATNFMSYLGCVALAAAIGILDKALHVDPFWSLGSTGGILIALAVLSSRATEIGNVFAFSLGWLASSFVTGWTKQIAAMQIGSIFFVASYIAWQRWAVVPDDIPQP